MGDEITKACCDGRLLLVAWGYVLAVVDVGHTANLGYKSKVGLSFVHAPACKQRESVAMIGTPSVAACLLGGR